MAEVPGIHADRVTAFFRARVPGAADGPLRFELIAGGRSNLTYRVHGADGRVWVLRRPPLGHVLPTAHDMAREHRVLAGLAGTDVPAPRPLALCDDPTVNDAPFYVMTWCPGVVLHDELPPGFAETPADRRRIADALVDVLVRLHAVDVHAVGLDGLGRPDGYLARQVKRWAQQWEGNKTAELPAIDALLARLAAALPTSPPPTIVHGDYRLGNMALAPDDPGRVVAVFDWEMATLGDPLADLGYTLIYWAEPGDPPSHGLMPALTAAPGFPSRADLLARYAAASGRDVEAVDFYQVLALTKLAVISEGIWKRHLLGKTIGDGGWRATEFLAERALAVADASHDRRLRG